MDVQPLLTLQGNLRAIGAKISANPAPSITRDALGRFVALLVDKRRFDVAAACLLSWKSASRWGDVRRLTRAHILRLTPESIIVDWRNLPKGWRGMRAHPSRYTQVCGRWTPELCRLLQQLGQFGELTAVTTSQISKMFQANKETEHCRAHSVKHGAFDHLVRLRAQGVIPEGSDELISRTLKHRAHCALPDVSIGYANDHIAMAEFLGTHMITQHL
eukprot:TRINITY_DN12034_c0_g1_i2.p2 TRINITY_DN12034_c0_g1~~TRINITY_DN12034_c0_g1_i2.p2  ORF type:complete len:217 (-),score=23.78 TRINITY_DN12034_c0_g1_i2:492-1142(-)